MALGFFESMLPLDFIAPGVKLGLANAAALLLIYSGDIFGAALVNLTRILLSAVLFSGVSSLPFSLCGAAGALAVMAVISKFKAFGIIGASAAGGAIHNLLQGAVALFITGKAAAVYLPWLLLCGAASGTLVGTVGYLIRKKCGDIFSL